MKITLAKTAGFCFGVNKAVNTVYELLTEGKKVCTLGPIIHNPQLVEELAQKGVRIVSSPLEVKQGETLVIRSHGVEKSVIDQCVETNTFFVDATCPFVAKIHKIVSQYSDEGYITIVAGDKNHQEVKGIIGHTNGESYVVANTEELGNLLKSNPHFVDKNVILVSQTTFNAKIWEKVQKFLKKVCTNAKIFDTMCNATSMRQEEAHTLSLSSDAVIVIGGRHSSNTAKLYDVCKANCEKTFLIETKEELPLLELKGCENIGVVAGASTPAGIIKEAIKTMSENLQPKDEQLEVTVEKTFEEMTDEEALEASLNSMNSDQKVVGTVIAVNKGEVTVDIGRGVTGYISAAELSSDPELDLEKEVKIDDQINLIIMKINDQEGTAMLSKRRYDAIAGWDKIKEAKDSGEVLTGYVKDIIKGGVVAYTNNIRVFIPASQATASRNDSLDELKGKEVSFRIIEIGRGRRAVGSIRSVLRDQRKEAEDKVWADIAVGDRFNGVVKSLTGYGAFVDIGGVDGMVHISELSWARIKNPAEVVSVGDVIEVYVKDLDTEKRKISLGYKKAEDNPWTIFQNNYNVDDTVKVTIVSMTTYGAFARIIPGIDGLIHISQIANKHVAKPQDELKIGQEVEAKITAVDLEQKRVSLSIRALLPEEVVEEATEETVVDAPAEEAVETANEVVEAPAEEVVEETAE